MEVNEREDGNYKIRESISSYKQNNTPHDTFPLLENQELFNNAEATQFHSKGMPSNDTTYLNEPKAKKRRKQSNPSRYQTTPLPPNFEDEKEHCLENNNLEHLLPLQERCVGKQQLDPTSNFHCPQCGTVFPSQDVLRIHLEEEHTSKLTGKLLQKLGRPASVSEQDNNYEVGKDSNLSGSDCQLQLVTTNEKWLYNTLSNSHSQEDKGTPFSLPNVPPLVAVSEGVDRNISLPLPVFPNSMAPLFFPVSPHSQASFPNENSNPNAGLRIFNPEAYCELCNKEFCNKYFLKTHKANKHGIYSLDSIPNSSCPRMLNNNTPRSMPLSQYLPSSEFPPTVQAMPNLESYCEICQKEFCNKYFLRKHKQKIHGIVDLNQNSSPITCDTKTVAFTSSSNSPSFSSATEKSVKPNQDQTIDNSRAEIAVSSTHAVVSSTHENQRIQIPPIGNRVISYFSIPGINEEKTISQDASMNDKSSFSKDKLREMGIINLEAFCEICCKEFCNKYFLRTHKLNMHGIGNPESPNKTLPPTLPQPQIQPLQLTISERFDNMNDNKENDYRVESLGDSTNQQSFSSGELSCNMCNRPFASPYLLKMHKFYTHNIPFNKEENQLYSAEDQEHSQKQNINEPLQPPPLQENNTIPGDTVSQDLQKLQSMIKELNASTSVENNKVCCNLCQLEFDNKYFLRAHVMNEHGVLTHEDGNVHSNREGNSGMISSNSNELQRPCSSSLATDVSSRVRCELCQKEFCSMYFLKSHKLNIHGICPETNSASKLPSSTEEVATMKNDGNTSASSNSNEKLSTVSGRNYCNICNKELCNKYFMKTHMLKMHGINVETQANEAALNSSIGGVTCDICQKELCSKYFLKVHKQNTHGISEDPIPSKDATGYSTQSKDSVSKNEENDFNSRYFSYYTEVCPICDRRFKSIKWLKTHMINDHGEIIKEKLCLQINNFNPGINIFCFICNQIFADKIALQIHLIKDHHTTPEDLESLNNSGTKQQSISSSVTISDPPDINGTPTTGSSSLISESQLHSKRLGGSGTRIYHCSYCIYSTRWLSNLYAHEKRHTGINLEGEKKFVCRICYRAYRYNHSLQRHMLSHKSVGLSLRSFVPSSMSPSSNQQLQNVTALSLLSNIKENIPNEMNDEPVRVKRYRCSKCNRKFLSREMCLTHIHSTHKGRRLEIGQQKFVKSFRCHVCNFVTRAWNILKIHIRKHHPQEAGSDKQCTDLPADKLAMLEYSTSAPSTPVAGSMLPAPLPMTYAMPQNPPQSGSYIMQPFLLAQPEQDGNSNGNAFVPSLVYLPVCQKVLQPLTVPLTLTPA